MVEIKELIAKKLTEKHGGYFEENLERTSFIPRFFLKENSIEFVFSEYEVTPGVCGAVNIDIEYKTLLDLIRHDGVLGYMVPFSGSWEAGDHFVKGIKSELERLEKEK